MSSAITERAFVSSAQEVGTGTPLSLQALLQALKLDEPSSPPGGRGRRRQPRLPVAAGPAGINHQAAPLKGAILHRHNVYRSQIASGVVPGLPAAACMLQMVSDRLLRAGRLRIGG